MTKKKKIITLLFVFLILVAGAVALFFVLQRDKSKKEEPVTNTNTNQTPVEEPDRVSLIFSDAYTYRQYGKYLEVEKEGNFSVLDLNGKVVLDNPLYLAYAISSSIPVYQGKDLSAVSSPNGEEKNYKIYQSLDNPSMGYALIFNDTLEYKDSLKNFYLGNDMVITVSHNKKTEENKIVKYNVKTGEILATTIADGDITLFTWNGKDYLAINHSNLLDTEKLSKVFAKDYKLGDEKENYEGIYSASSKYLTAYYEGKYGLIDENGAVVVPFNYLELKQIPNKDIIKVKTKDGYGIINNRHQIILEATYNQLDIYDNYIVAVDPNGILKILNNRYEPFFTSTQKVYLNAEIPDKGTKKVERVSKVWNFLKYENMLVDGDEDSPIYAVIFNTGTNKAKEFISYKDVEVIYNSPASYNYVLLKTEKDLYVYDGIVERAKISLVDHEIGDIINAIYVNETYITFEEVGTENRYFINMKTNKLENTEDVSITEADIPHYDTLNLDNEFLIDFDNNRVSIHDDTGKELFKMEGNAIVRSTILDGNYYEVSNGDKISLIHINN